MGLILGVIIALVFIVRTTVIEAIHFIATPAEESENGEKTPTTAAKVVTVIYLVSIISTVIVGFALSVS